MIKKLVHFSDLHIRLFKDHDLYRSILNDMFDRFREIKPDRIVFTGDLVHSKNQMTPELIEFVAETLTECSKIAKTILIIGNHDFLENNMSRLDALFHGPIQGLTTDIGYKFESGFESDKFAGCDLVLCGDIHKRQVFNIPGGKKAYMVGSTIQQNYGETINKHGFGIYDVISDEYTFVDLKNPKPFLSFKITSYDDILEDGEKLLNV